MKYFGCILDFTKERNDDLMRAYNLHLVSARRIVMPDFYQKVADSPARRFWVSERRASVVVSSMLAGRPLIKMRSNKREMFEEIFRRFLIERRRFPDKCIYELVSRVVNQPAPKFYLTPRTVYELICRIKIGWYDKHYERYRQYLEGDGH